MHLPPEILLCVHLYSQLEDRRQLEMLYFKDSGPIPHRLPKHVGPQAVEDFLRLSEVTLTPSDEVQGAISASVDVGTRYRISLEPFYGDAQYMMLEVVERRTGRIFLSECTNDAPEWIIFDGILGWAVSPF